MSQALVSNPLFSLQTPQVLHPQYAQTDPLSLTASLSDLWPQLAGNGTSFGNSPYVLMAGGCQPLGSTQDDCATACTNAAYLFSSSQVFENCLVASYVAANLSQSSASTAEEAAALGIQNDSPAIPVLADTIGTCLSNYCNASEKCANNGQTCRSDILLPGGKALDPVALQNCYEEVCAGVSLLLDSDIGGIGVYLSYFIQIGLALTGFIGLTAVSLRKHHFARLRQAFTGSQDPIPISHPTALEHLRACFIAALAEFHRAQCYFAIAVQIACIVVLYTSALQPTSFIQATMNFNFILSVANNNMYCIAFTYWYMRSNLERTTYAYLLSVVSISLAFATSFVAASQYTIPVVLQMTSASNYEFCGNTSPLLICSANNVDTAIVQKMRVGLGLTEGLKSPSSQIVASCLGWSFMARATMSDVRPLFKDRLLPITSFFARHPRTRCAGKAFWVWVKTLALLFWIVAIFVFDGDLYQYFEYGAINTTSWGIGQIIGITIWSPAFLEFIQIYVNTLTDGSLKNGFSHRLPKGYIAREKSRGSDTDSLYSDHLRRHDRFELFIDALDDLIFCALKRSHEPRSDLPSLSLAATKNSVAGLSQDAVNTFGSRKNPKPKRTFTAKTDPISLPPLGLNSPTLGLDKMTFR